MTDYNNIYLYSKNKLGKILQWRAFSNFQLNSEGFIEIIVEFGQQEGKLQTKIVLKHSLEEPGKYIKGVYLIFFNIFFKYFSKL